MSLNRKHKSHVGMTLQRTFQIVTRAALDNSHTHMFL